MLSDPPRLAHQGSLSSNHATMPMVSATPTPAPWIAHYHQDRCDQNVAYHGHAAVFNHAPPSRSLGGFLYQTMASHARLSKPPRSLTQF